jgi:hypothetical protein
LADSQFSFTNTKWFKTSFSVSILIRVIIIQFYRH